MKLSMIGVNTNVHKGNSSKAIFAGNSPILQSSLLKSTQEKQMRQQKAGEQIGYWEQQKENLKKTDCGSIDEITRKLETLHSYEDEIAAVKMEYNGEQMWHTMDEAMELGEKIAKAVEKMEPKTPEERKKEMVEEALGIEEENGLLTESMVEITQDIEALENQQVEEDLEEIVDIEESATKLENTDSLLVTQQVINATERERLNNPEKYKSIDILI